jgi:glycosyltransferase involved in cell wall biosynthesis
MKILLLADIPPCKNFTAGLVLDQLCRFLPRGSIACFTVSVRELNAKISPDLEWIPIQYEYRPKETSTIFSKRIPSLHTLVNLGLYMYNGRAIRRIASKAIKFGRSFGADTLWCTLQGPTQLRLALPVATGLGIPLLTEIYDPPAWILRAQSTPNVLQAILLRKFDTILRKSHACATASWPMAQQYAERYDTKTVALLPSLDQSVALPPAISINSGKELVIGMAGQIYATEEWKALIHALDSVHWKICDRDVRIRLLGRWASFNVVNPVRIEYLGWHTQEKSVELLSEADILYLPYPFDPAFETEARLSFPSKLTTYFAAGRPVLFHGPAYASPWEFLVQNEAGYRCETNDQVHIIDALSTLTTDMGLYSRLTHNGRIAFDKYLTLSSLRQSFATFLGVEEDFLVPDR